MASKHPLSRLPPEKRDQMLRHLGSGLHRYVGVLKEVKNALESQQKNRMAIHEDKKQRRLLQKEAAKRRREDLLAEYKRMTQPSLPQTIFVIICWCTFIAFIVFEIIYKSKL